MKKIISFLLVLSVVMTMSVCAFATYKLFYLNVYDIFFLKNSWIYNSITEAANE